MKKQFLITLISLLNYSVSLAKDIYVNKSNSYGNFNGTWKNSYSSLLQAIDIGEMGDQIFVAEGTYKPASVSAGIFVAQVVTSQGVSSKRFVRS